MSLEIALPSLIDCEKEGEEAFANGQAGYRSCAYTFANAKVPQTVFDDVFRPRLCAFTQGWYKAAEKKGKL